MRRKTYRTTFELVRPVGFQDISQAEWSQARERIEAAEEASTCAIRKGLIEKLLKKKKKSALPSKHKDQTYKHS
jgi:hypothetical protein